MFTNSTTKAYVLLKKLGFTALPPLDYAVDEVEGFCLYFLESNFLMFKLKSRTNTFSAGLIHRICVACATMGKGKLHIEVDEAASGGLLQALKASTLSEYMVGSPLNSWAEHTCVKYEISFDYNDVKM